MLSEAIITFRETLEAALVVGIILAYLNKTKQTAYNPTVYLAVASAIVGSILTAFAFTLLIGEFKGPAENLFEGGTMLFAALLLTTMIFWMLQQKQVRQDLEEKVTAEVSRRNKLGLFALVFASVLREGVETVIFLGAGGFSANATALGRFAGSFLGIFLALACGFILFVQARRLNIKKFFHATSIVLILFAAGLVARGVYELQEGGFLQGYGEPVWDVNPPQNPDGSYPLLHDKGFIGGLAGDLFGYTGSPSLLEAASYALYLAFAVLLYARTSKG